MNINKACVWLVNEPLYNKTPKVSNFELISWEQQIDLLSKKTWLITCALQFLTTHTDQKLVTCLREKGKKRSFPVLTNTLRTNRIIAEFVGVPPKSFPYSNVFRFYKYYLFIRYVLWPFFSFREAIIGHAAQLTCSAVKQETFLKSTPLLRWAAVGSSTMMRTFHCLVETQVLSKHSWFCFQHSSHVIYWS